MLELRCVTKLDTVFILDWIIELSAVEFEN